MQNPSSRQMSLGMLNAQEKMTGHVNMANYQALYDQLIVKRGIKWL